jgi:hypothetical protein
MSSNYGFEPTLDGLNNIDSDSTTTNNIICNTLLVNTTANAPTVAPSSNDTSVATTAWVTAHAGGAYVTIGTDQTVTGEKTFSNALTKITGTLRVDDIEPSVGTATSDVYSTQTSGVLNIGTFTTRSGLINIGNGGSATNDIRIGTARNTAGVITIGSNNSDLNTLNLQSSIVNVGTSSPVLSTNTVNIGNGQNGSTIEALSLLNVYDALVMNSGSIYSPLGTSMVVSAPGLTDDLTLIGGNTIALIGTTNITGTTTITGAGTITGQASAGSIMTNTYNPFLATADVNINPTQTSGSLNLGTKIDRSGIIQIGNGVNATCDIRIGTARTTGGTVSMGSNSSIANTLNLQSALINVGTGSPVGTANTINIGNGNAGSLIDLKNDTTITGATNINTTGTSATSIGNSTGTLTLTGGTQTINATTQTITATNQTTNATTQIRQDIGGVAKLQLTANTSYLYGGTALELHTNGIQRVRITSSGVQFQSFQINNGFVYPINFSSATGFFTTTTTATKGTVANINLASITIGSTPGCYLVEGSFLWSGTGTAQNYTALGLSTTSLTFDATRQQVFYQGNVAGGYGNRMSSIFNVNAAVTFYLIMQVPTAVGAATVQTNYLSVTKIA